MKNSIFSCILAGFAVLVPLSAQESSPVTFKLGAGYNLPLGGTFQRLDMGWGITGGAGVNFGRYVGVMVDLDYNTFGIRSGRLAVIGAPGGSVNVFSATLDPIVHLIHGRSADLYITGGGGLYHYQQEFTAPGSANVLGFDPFFGFYPTVIPVTQILASYSVNKPGVDAGIGLAVPLRGRAKFFVETHYNKIFTGNHRHMDYEPVSFGVRW